MAVSKEISGDKVLNPLEDDSATTVDDSATAVDDSATMVDDSATTVDDSATTDDQRGQAGVTG